MKLNFGSSARRFYMSTFVEMVPIPYNITRSFPLHVTVKKTKWQKWQPFLAALGLLLCVYLLFVVCAKILQPFAILRLVAIPFTVSRQTFTKHPFWVKHRV